MGRETIVTYTDNRGREWTFGKFENFRTMRYFITDGWHTSFPLLRKSLRRSDKVPKYFVSYEESHVLRIPKVLKQEVKRLMIERYEASQEAALAGLTELSVLRS